VRAAVGIEERDPVAAVAVDQVVHEQRARVAPGDRDAPVARGAAVVVEAVALEMNGRVLVVAAQQGDALTPRP
jgi:hypothetical protein